MNDMTRGNDALVGFLFGAVVGAGIALLVAPAPGHETRRRIGETANRLANNTKEQLDKVRNRIGEVGENLKHRAEEGTEQFRRGAENVRQGQTYSSGTP